VLSPAWLAEWSRKHPSGAASARAAVGTGIFTRCAGSQSWGFQAALPALRCRSAKPGARATTRSFTAGTGGPPTSAIPIRTSPATQTPVQSRVLITMTSRPTGFPDGAAERADLGFSWHVRKFPGSAGDFHTQLVAQVPEHFLEVGVVGSFAAQVIGELAGLPRGGCAAGPARGRGRHRGSWEAVAAASCRGRRSHFL
jgi:hypothetical protein